MSQWHGKSAVFHHYNFYIILLLNIDHWVYDSLHHISVLIQDILIISDLEIGKIAFQSTHPCKDWNYGKIEMLIIQNIFFHSKVPDFP